MRVAGEILTMSDRLGTEKRKRLLTKRQKGERLNKIKGEKDS